MSSGKAGLFAATLIAALCAGAAPMPTVSNGRVGVSVDLRSGSLVIADLRTGREWRSFGARPGTGPVVDAVASGGRLSYRLPVRGGVEMTLNVRIELDERHPEFTVSFTSDDPMVGDVWYPNPLLPAKDDRMIVPYDEGMAFPVGESEPDGGTGGSPLPAYGGVLSMPFFGHVSDADGSGLMVIFETRDDVMLDFARSGGDRLLSGVARWKSQKGQLGYERRLRYSLFPKGGHVALAKRYRLWAKRNSHFKTFAEKVRERPNVDRLLGAVNFWFMRGDAMKMIDRLDECGIRRVLWSHVVTPEATRRLAARPETLVGRYDIYTDSYYPALMSAMGRPGEPGTNGEAWPADILWTSADSNAWCRSWDVKLKDGSSMPTAKVCARMMAKHLRRRVAADLRERPFTSRFLDVTAAAEAQECYNPLHPMTRSDNIAANREFLGIVGGEFGLVVGSETGGDAYVDVMDYSEGMMSICPYRVPESGRDIERIWHEVPEKTARYQVGERYRIPLWELVYHDCVCAHWFWGDYQNKLPALWRKRDLLNVLYGTMPMFLVSGVEAFDRDAGRFTDSYRMTSPVARATGYSEMLDHLFLTEDREVQRTRFSDGTVVTVNFGDVPWTAEDGAVIRALDFRVTRDGR